jgi:pSer/pThr/pTyr-binding forkhead associated (FHA) protein
MYKLVIEDDDGNKTVVPVIRDEISIGRQDGNTIRLTERNVSRKHARLVREEGGVFIEELSARYGVRKNGEKISGRQDFAIGDVYLIGDYRLTLLAEGAEAEASKNGAVASAMPTPLSAPPAKLQKPVKPASAGFTSEPTMLTRVDGDRRSQGTEILPAQPAKIVVVSSNFAGQEFPLVNKEMVIGRAEDCDIIVDHRSVSQKHAKIVREASGNYKIVDLNSKNGVKVSGEDYRAVHLKRGDIVELGHVKFRFVEPGENYVFTPQAIIEDTFGEPSVQSGGNKKMLIGVAVGIAVLVGVVAIYMGTRPSEETPADDVAVVDVTTNSETTAPTVVSNVEPQIAQAREKLAAGAAGKAITILELARDTMSPNTDERSQIDEMLSAARREKPLEEALDDSRKYLRDSRFVDALSELKKIPPGDSVTRAIVEKEDLSGKIIDQIMSKANAALQEGDKKQAGALIEEVLLYEPQNADANSMKESLDKTPVKVAAKKTEPSGDTTATKKPKVDTDEVATEAQKKVFAGDHQGAIKTCWGVKDAKCYRIVGLAYKNLGEIEKSCASFKKAGVEPPHCK